VIQIEKAVLSKYARSRINFPFRTSPTLSQIFHENTKLTPLTSRAYGAAVHAYARSQASLRLAEQPYKLYTLMDQVELGGRGEPASDLERAIFARCSMRSFSGRGVSAAELGHLLLHAYGRRDPEGRFRVVASGGALYPLEWYACVHRGEDLAPGVYHYAPEHHRLDVLERGPVLERLRASLAFDTIDAEQAAAVLIVTAVFRRSTIKYQDRGYRMVLMEAGETAQNLSLVATQMRMGTCYVGGFNDDILGALLGVDGVEEAPLLPIVLGWPKAEMDERRDG